MAGRWSSEHFVAEYKDLQASAMAVDCLGNWVLLAGRKNLAFVDLNKPSQTVVKVTRQSKWDIGCVQWNGQPSHSYRFVTACNQRLDVFDFTGASASHLCSMKAHSRTVSDVDWSPFDVNIVASCSVDTFTYFWDIRDSKKPVKSFQTVSGAYQVKWNKITNNKFATTHDGDVRIWDPRMGNDPVHYISAHPSKIHGLDWSPNDEHKLVTASQDCTIRFWDYNTPRRSEAMIKTGNPVWRARFTPFGTGVMSVVVPQLRRGENSLSLWHQHNCQDPVHTFVGHKDVIMEFQWRKQPEGAKDHQLVTWSKDQSLRIWKVDMAVQKLCGHEGTDSVSELADDDLLTLSTAGADGDYCQLGMSMDVKPAVFNNSTGSINGSLDDPNSSPTVFLPFEKEMENLTGRLAGVRIEQIEPGRRSCVLKVQRSSKWLDLELYFPTTYPVDVAPVVTVLHTNLDADTQSRVVKMFSDVACQLVKQKLNCVETSLRQVLPVIDKSSSLDGQSREDRKLMLESKYHVEKVKSPTSPISPASHSGHSATSPMYPTGSFQDSSVPFPRTSGARFCSNDRLVVFSVPAFLKKVHEDQGEINPRALSDLVTCTQSQWIRSQQSFSPLSMFIGSPPMAAPAVSISDFFTEKHSRSRHRQISVGHHSSHHLHHHHHKTSGGYRSSRDSNEVRRDRERDAERQSKKLQKVGAISIYDISSINPLSKYLAENYKLDLQDVPDTCCHNAAVAMKIGRSDLVQLWKLVHQMSHPSLQPLSIEAGPPWAYNPFGRGMVEKFLSHYSAVRDVQTMAMICCMFWDKEPPMMRDLIASMSRPESRLSFEYAAANMEVAMASSTDSGWNVFPVIKNKRSLSWSNSYDDIKMLEDKDPKEREMERERIQHHNNSKMLDPELKHQYELIKKAYADVLYNWNLLNKRIEVLKHTDCSSAVQPKGIEFGVSCHNCKEFVKGLQCKRCTYTALNCSICHIGVRGVANLCLACGHGGHTEHMMAWFSESSVCPTGCGCHCVQESTVPLTGDTAPT